MYINIQIQKLKVTSQSCGDHSFDCMHTIFGLIKNNRLLTFIRLISPVLSRRAFAPTAAIITHDRPLKQALPDGADRFSQSPGPLFHFMDIWLTFGSGFATINTVNSI
jgi:hypothetical protein